jgi:hypothetical protein
VGLREQWREQVSQLRQMYDWLLQTERILSGAWATPEDIRSLELVAQRFDAWIAQLTELAAGHSLDAPVQTCLQQFLKITEGLRSHLIQCYDLEGFPRTNNDMESYIRSLKTRYRRVSGHLLQSVGHQRWQAMRARSRSEQREQLKLYRFRHRRECYLAELEARWEKTALGT